MIADAALDGCAPESRQMRNARNLRGTLLERLMAGLEEGILRAQGPRKLRTWVV
jgi:hypothetical protein